MAPVTVRVANFANFGSITLPLTVTMLKWLGNVLDGKAGFMYSARTPDSTMKERERERKRERE